MMPPPPAQQPPRILILDNDETTGSYNLLFHLYDLFARASFGPQLNPAITMSVITRYARAAGVFRKGLQRLLVATASLKAAGRIDKVIMYTNQLDVRQIRGMRTWRTEGIEWSVPQMIQIMLVYLANSPDLIDIILTRPVDLESLTANYPVKDLTRAFRAACPGAAVDLRLTRFLDDLADEKYMIDSSNSNTDAESRIKLAPYRARLDPRVFRRVVFSILEKHGIMLSEPDRRLLDRQEALWLDANWRIEPQNLDTSFEELVPVLKHVYSKTDT